MVRLRIKGSVKSGNASRLCIFAHFDRDSLVDDYVLFHLRQLLAMDTDIIFVTPCSGLSVDQLAKLDPLCTQIVLRINEGRDIGSFRVGLSLVENLLDYQEVVLANDSVYGPLFPLDSVWKEMTPRGYDMWGITDSWSGGGYLPWDAYHVQSYFLVMNRRFLSGDMFRRFWQEHDFTLGRDAIIHNYEIGLSRRAKEAGYRIGAYCDYCEVRDFILAHCPNYRFRDDLRRFWHNPTHFCWRELIQRFHCPFLKVDFVRDNHSRIPDACDWAEVLRESTPYDPTLILKHFARITRPAVPTT